MKPEIIKLTWKGKTYVLTLRNLIKLAALLALTSANVRTNDKNQKQ